MKRLVLILACLAIAAVSLPAQTVVDADVCNILNNPKSFDGKMVRIKGTVVAGFDIFAIRDNNCRQSINAIWLDYPAGVKAKSGPAAVVELQLAKNSPGTPQAESQTPVAFDHKSKDFKQFDKLLAEQFKAPARCLGCPRYTVSATLVGRLDGVANPGLVKDAKGMFTAINGFGNLNRYSARLVLQSVSDVKEQEIDYSKAAKLPKANPDQQISDEPIPATHKIAKAFGASSQFGDAIERAAAAFGANGKTNGVSVDYSRGNDIPKDEGQKARDESTDGLAFNVILDRDRLPGFALEEALSHTGTEIADFRDGKYTENMFQLEAHAWQVTFFSAVAVQDKSFTAPGDYVLWNAAWPESDRPKNASDALETYLSTWAALQR